MAVCASRMTVRRGARSAIEPPHSESGRTGISPMAVIKPSAAADPVSRYTSTCCAIICIQVPTSESPWPKNQSRKLRWESARNMGGSRLPAGCKARVVAWWGGGVMSAIIVENAKWWNMCISARSVVSCSPNSNQEIGDY